MNLFDINHEIEIAENKAIDMESGEILDEVFYTLLNELKMAKEEKVENLCCLYKNINADAEALKAQADEFTRRYKSAKNKADSIKNYITITMDGEKFSSPRASLRWTTTHPVIVECDPATLPEKFRKATYEAKKTELKTALENGEIIEGCSIGERRSVSIR